MQIIKFIVLIYLNTVKMIIVSVAISVMSLFLRYALKQSLIDILFFTRKIDAY